MDGISPRFFLKRIRPATQSNIFSCQLFVLGGKNNRKNVLLKANNGVVRYRVWGTLEKPLFLP
jgi:hypothetical protein